MKIRIFVPNQIQRLLLFGASAIIGALLVLQISEAGLSESNWIFGVLIITALLVVATNGIQITNLKNSVSHKNIMKTANRSVPLEVFLTEAKQQFSARFLEIWEKESKSSGLKIDFGLPMGPATDPVAWKAAYMVVFLSLNKRNAQFEDTQDASKLAAKTAVEIATSTKRLQAAIQNKAWSIANLDQEDMKIYLKEVVECRFRVVKTMRLLAQNADDPFDPIFSLITKEFPFGGSTAKAREQAYGSVARNIMRDMTR